MSNEWSLAKWLLLDEKDFSPTNAWGLWEIENRLMDCAWEDWYIWEFWF